MHRYITTTLPYVNADPHCGYAVEILQADVLARSWRARGDDVFFSTGTDEHGQKIFQKAQETNQDVQSYVNHYANEFRKLQYTLALSNDTFIRTTDPDHITAAQELWKRSVAAEDIYKKKYSGLYCVGDEAFIKETDLVDGKCPNHPSLDLVHIEEENYFFRFSKYQEALKKYLEREGSIVPEWRRKEALKFVESGLEDFSISREAARMSWGIPVPGDDTQIVYVWFDALANYISTLGWPQDSLGRYKTFWEDGTTLQVAGKDQVRFQSLIWQAMLMSANLPTTDTIFYHGFIVSGGQKMSKSLGNVISPYELVDKYGTEATRYLLLHHVHPTGDTDVTWERLDEWYTANLVNGLGNLVARVLKLSETYLDAPIEILENDTHIDPMFTKVLEEFRFNEAMDLIFDMIAEADGLMTEREPFKKVKNEDGDVREQGKKDIALLCSRLVAISTHLAPFMPETSKRIDEAVRTNRKPENLFPRLP